MFIDKAAAIVAMLFGAFILAHPNPGMAAEPGAKLFNPQPDPPDLGVAKPAEFNPAPEPAPEPGVDKAMGVLPSLGTKGPVIPGQNVGMEFGDTDPDDKKSARKGIVIGNKPGGLPSPGASKGIIVVDTIPGVGPHDQRPAIPGGIAAKGLSPPNTLGGAASKGIFPSENKPVSPGKLPAGKGMMIKGK